MRPNLIKHLYDQSGTFKVGIVYHPLFLFGLIIKLYASAIFAGSNFANLFIPFLKYYTNIDSENVYTYFFNQGILEVFPYPQLMLYIMALPGMIFSPWLLSSINYISSAELMAYHLPLLAADTIILLVLARWLKNKHTELLWLYWLSPILFYINYLHSQLDVIPIAFVFLFLHFLFKERWLVSFLFLGAAISTKFHIIILVPFVLVYLYRQYKSWKLITWCSGLIGIFFIAINNSSLLQTSFLTIVFQNREQFKIFDLQIQFGGETSIYIIPTIYIILFLHSLTFKRFNRDTFVMFLGFSFGLLTLLIPPMQGWYYWIIPFFIYFYIKNDQADKLPFYLLTASYFVYFASIPTADYFEIFAFAVPSIAALPNLYTFLVSQGINAQLVSNLALTLLQATLLINVAWLYRRGVEESKKHKLYNMPYLVGIAGDSGSGKSTLAALLKDIFNESNVAIVPGDAMHKWERGNPMWEKFTHLNPQANTLHTDLEYAQALQAGNDVYRRQYDHHSGTFTIPQRLESKKLVVFEGLHSLYLSRMQQALDLKIFITPDEQLRIHWKVCRDISERGYTKERVIEQINIRSGDSLEYINSQAKYADIVISLKSKIDLADLFGEDIELDTYLEIRCDNSIFMEQFCQAISDTATMDAGHSFDADRQILRFDGKISEQEIEQLSYSLVPELYDVAMVNPVWSSNYSGVEQLFICYYIVKSLSVKNSYGQ